MTNYRPTSHCDEKTLAVKIAYGELSDADRLRVLRIAQRFGDRVKLERDQKFSDEMALEVVGKIGMLVGWQDESPEQKSVDRAHGFSYDLD